MPKYSISEVLDIIKNLSNEEKLELQKSLPSILGTITTAFKPVDSLSQNIQGNTFGNGNSGIEFNQVQASKGSSVNQTKTQATLQNADAQSALNLLSSLKHKIDASDALNQIEKKSLEVPLQIIEEELKNPKPDKSSVDQAIEFLKKSLTGVAELAEPVLKLAPLVAKVWAGI